jgi:diguanylate cyclase (GGDEF)-like protein
MDNYTSDMNRERSIGVVCCDITGLKAVNDIQGHHAGDELIVRAANSIKTIFPDYAKFRTGGDEFLILCSGITEDCLRERAARLRDESLKNSALMAVGCVWYPSCPENIDKLLTEADEEMYADKRNYYSNIKYERRQVMS